MNKIFIIVQPTGINSYGVIQNAEPTGDVISYALAEDGECLTSHYSSGVNWAKHDMGITSNWKHEIYDQKYADGYELIWIDWETKEQNMEYIEAYNKNQGVNAKRQKT